MDAMDKLFALYEQYFDQLVADARRLHQRNPALNPPSVSATKMTREQFEQYLNNQRETESKRLFLRRILRGHESLYPVLPENLRSLANRAA